MKVSTIILYSSSMLAIAVAPLVFLALQPEILEIEPLGSGWEYRWDGEPWRPIDEPINPPNRSGRNTVIYRVRLPDLPYRAPALFVYSIDTSAEFFLNGEVVYRFGSVEEGDFYGWPWHLIDLDPDAAGSILEIRVSSGYQDIGLFGDILLGDRSSQIRRLYRRDLARVIVCAISGALAIIFFGIYLMLRNLRSFLFFSLLSMILAFRVFSFSLTKQFVLCAPVFWEYFRMATYCLTPAAVSVTIGEIVGGRSQRILNWIAIFFVATCVVVITLPLLGAFPVYTSYGFVDAAIVVALIAVVVAVVGSTIHGNVEAGMLLINTVIIGLLLGYSILMFKSMVPWNDEVDYLMLLQLTFGLMVILIRRFVFTQRVLTETNAQLEARVGERTRQLADANARLTEEKRHLKNISITDSLTELRNRSYVLERLRVMISEANRYDRRLSVALFDIDHFKLVNDNYGHQQGDRVLREVADAIARGLRESDVAGRYGGEEFLVLLSGTKLDEAWQVAERIRAAIDSTDFGEVEGPTISGGVAEYGNEEPESLLRRADLKLYEAKDLGRNRIAR